MEERSIGYEAFDAGTAAQSAREVNQTEKATAAVAYYERELCTAKEAVERITAKRAEMAKFINEVNAKVESAQVEVQRLEEELAAAKTYLEELNGE